MEIAISGASGFLGSKLVPYLMEAGHKVKRLVRKKQGISEHEIPWNPYKEFIERQALEGVDALIHLSGERIDGRWTKEKKQRIRDSRVLTTQFLCKTLLELQNPPATWICASAIGIYGNRGNAWLTEESPPGEGFLADVCKDWEAATLPATKKGIRVVNLRIGVVLSPDGGALAKMLLPFKMGLGGVIGSGDQYWSWIAMDDLLAIFLFTLTHETLQGPVNAVAPNPVTNREFTRLLGRVLHRPTLLPLPAFMARLILGEMGEVLLMSSARVKPEKLLESDFTFHFPELELALRHLLKNTL